MNNALPSSKKQPSKKSKGTAKRQFLCFLWRNITNYYKSRYRLTIVSYIDKIHLGDYYMKKSQSKFKLNTSIFVFFTIIYYELILKAFTCERFFDSGLLIMPIFSCIFALIVAAICSKFSKKTAKYTTLSILTVMALIYIAQIIYHGFFGSYFIFYSLIAGGAGQITGSGMLGSTFKAILSGLPASLLILVPIVVYIIYGGTKIIYRKIKWLTIGLTAVTAICLHIVLILIISVSGGLSSLQSGDFDPNLTMGKFGLIRTEILDIKYNVLGFGQDIDLTEETPIFVDNTASAPTPPGNNETVVKPIDTSPNIVNIDFNKLLEDKSNKQITTLNEYFSTKEPTLKNAYTGMYKGYNLITITAEGFSPYAIDKDLTPTLYKMQQEGFKFENFYTPIWGVSTSDGEYAACTGLLPKSGVWSFYRSGSNYMPYTLGNMFKSIGVDKTFAYHNHTYDYYNRDVSHPNMGYEYIAMGTGMEEYVKKRWPESDLEMITGSTKDYLSDDKPFHAYYMTVSGHLQYSFSGNSMSSKNRELVQHLNCSDRLKAYYACNIEFDRAMEKLLSDLNAAGVADKTVIAITPDHYPYGLEQDGDTYGVWRELLGHDVDTTFELYESCFLLYCQGTKDAPAITKPCSAVDIIPTILNLFGFEYDSRLLTGTDILSTTDCIVQFMDRSFISSMGKYNAKTKEFTLAEGKSFESPEKQEAYVKNVRTIINNRFKTSAGILETDYYGYVFGKK